MDLASSAVASDLASRFISFLINRFSMGSCGEEKVEKHISVAQNILQADIGNHSLILLQTTEYYKRELEMNPYQTLEQLRRFDDS